MLLHALNDQAGKPVDWWFMYKLPDDVGPAPAKGFNYLYYDSDTKGALALSKHTLDHGNSALHNTLNELFNSKDPNVGYILYNDEKPWKNARNKGTKGHVKGILAFNKATDTAFLLTHSTPRFPSVGEVNLPDEERKYGQTYLCITLENYSTANQIAHQLRHMHEPQVYASKLSRAIKSGEDLRLLAKGGKAPISGLSSVIEIQSKGGKRFKIIGKNRRWGKDFWIDLVAPSLQTDLLVESWIRGKTTPGEEHGDEVDNISYLDFEHLGIKNCKWKYTKDHAKWAVSIHEKHNWVCVGDINRMVSQEKRGGGTVAFQEPTLWKNLKEAYVKPSKK